jgi:tetratricopeptide (TPR) repeat protein
LRLAKAEQERQAKAAAEAEAKRKADEAERQRQANIRAEQDRQAEAKRKAEEEAERQRRADINPAEAFYNRATVYFNRGEYKQAVFEFDAVIRLNPNYALAFCWRGIAKLRLRDSGGFDDIWAAKRIDGSVNCPSEW